jgi:hypothetical protein
MQNLDLTTSNQSLSAIEKLEKQANTSGGHNVPAIPIYNHLKIVCQSDTAFAELVLQEHKTLEKCFGYVYEQVRKSVAKQSGTQAVWMSDEATYQLAEDYFRLDDAEIERRKEEERKKKEEERKAREAEAAKAREEAKANQKAQKAQKPKNKPKEKPKDKPKPEKKKAVVAEKAANQNKQMSLFE